MAELRHLDGSADYVPLRFLFEGKAGGRYDKVTARSREGMAKA